MIAILHYGMGNLRSVQKGFEKVGHQAVVTSDPAVVRSAEKVVLPGVGAFEDAIAELRRRELVRLGQHRVDETVEVLHHLVGENLAEEVEHQRREGDRLEH